MSEDLLPHIIELKGLASATASRVEALERHIGERQNTQATRLNGHSNRIRDLERAQWRRQGIVAVLAAGCTTALTYLAKAWPWGAS